MMDELAGWKGGSHSGWISQRDRRRSVYAFYRREPCQTGREGLYNSTPGPLLFGPANVLVPRKSDIAFRQLPKHEEARPERENMCPYQANDNNWVKAADNKLRQRSSIVERICCPPYRSLPVCV